MEQDKRIHTYTKPPRESFWRIFYVIALFIFALVGIWIASAPVYYFLIHQNKWIMISFVFIPLGICIAYYTLRHLRKLMWEDSHLSSYTLYDKKIEAVEWVEAYSKAPVEREISFDEISSIIASFYIVRETINESGFGNVITETAPILYIRYMRNGHEQVLNLLFPNHGDPNINVWLSHFKEKEIPLRFTAHTLYRADTQSLTDEQRLAYFNAGDVIVDFPFSESWLASEPKVRPAWEEKTAAYIEAEEERDPEFKKSRQKHTFRTWIPTMWLCSLVLYGLLYGYVKIGGFLPFSTGNIIPGLLIFTLVGFLFFFCLRKYLRWFYMFIYLGFVLVIGFWISVLTVDQSAAEADLGLTLSLAAILYPFVMWIPYVTIKRMAQKKKAGKQAGIHLDKV